ncbi:hypothetical protein [Delftia sp. CH05]|uniref:hypothetical protein n=1 Tax=Delftia sp. CH05 TaxID=2692194 RepID=UPI00135E4395|nr:hypothetical protein [Delftia sp. CH05]MXN31037.1 hypothetical protein [Delftia sp. CH05]
MPAAAAQAPEPRKYKRRAAPSVDAEGFKPEDAPPTWPFGKERPAPPEPEPDLSGLMPLDYLLGVMRDPGLPAPLRMQAATLAAQYCHPKPAPKSAKQEAEAERQKNRSSRFGRRQPPTLTAVQGGKS